MKLSIKGLALSAGIVWGGCILMLGLVNLAVPSYGTAVLAWASSIYPGFHNSRTFIDVLVGTGYGLVDAGIGGAIFGWLYNCFSGSAKAA